MFWSIWFSKMKKNFLHIAELKCTQMFSNQSWGEWKRLFCFNLILFISVSKINLHFSWKSVAQTLVNCWSKEPNNTTTPVSYPSLLGFWHRVALAWWIKSFKQDGQFLSRWPWARVLHWWLQSDQMRVPQVLFCWTLVTGWSCDQFSMWRIEARDPFCLE